jgi:hypothetical protein
MSPSSWRETCRTCRQLDGLVFVHRIPVRLGQLLLGKRTHDGSWTHLCWSRADVGAEACRTVVGSSYAMLPCSSPSECWWARQCMAAVVVGAEAC